MRLRMASARIFNMHTHESRSERALHLHVVESGFLGRSRSKTPFFSRFKTRFKSLIWNSFAFTWAKIRLRKGRITFWNIFRNVILAHVNTANVKLMHVSYGATCDMTILSYGWTFHADSHPMLIHPTPGKAMQMSDAPSIQEVSKYWDWT